MVFTISEIFHLIYSLEGSVCIGVFVILVTIAWGYLRNSETIENTSRPGDKVAALQKDEEYLREVSRCAMVLANHSPKEEEYPEFLNKRKNPTSVDQEESNDLEFFHPIRLDELGAGINDDDSMLVNLPDNLEEEQEEIELLDLTADDISVNQDTESEIDLSPQDMAEIAEELNGSLMSITSLDVDEPQETLEEEAVRVNEEAKKCYQKFLDLDKEKNVPSSQSESHDLVMDNVEFVPTEEIKQEEEREAETLENQHPEKSNEEREERDENASSAQASGDQEIALDSTVKETSALETEVSSDSSNGKKLSLCPFSSINDQKQKGAEHSDIFKTPSQTTPISAAPTMLLSDKLRKCNEILSGLSKEEAEEEERAKKEQLNSILEIMRNNPDTFGHISEEDMDTQFRLYCL